MNVLSCSSTPHPPPPPPSSGSLTPCRPAYPRTLVQVLSVHTLLSVQQHLPVHDYKHVLYSFKDDIIAGNITHKATYYTLSQQVQQRAGLFLYQHYKSKLEVTSNYF